jgi:hypothetical protein
MIKPLTGRADRLIDVETKNFTKPTGLLAATGTYSGLAKIG